MITVNREEFAGALERCSKITPVRPTQEIAGSVHLSFTGSELRYRTTDLKSELSGAVPAQGKAEFLAKPRAFLAALSALSGETVTIKPSKDSVELKGETKRSFQIETLDAGDFPPPIPIGKSEPLSVEGVALARLVSLVQHSARLDDDRAGLRQIRLDSPPGKLRATAADGHRLAIAEIESSVQLSACITPELARAISSFEGEGSIFITASDRATRVVIGNETLVSLNAAEHYPTVERYLETTGSNATVTVSVDTLLDAVRAVQRVDSERDVLFRFSRGKLAIECSGGGKGSDEIDLECSVEHRCYLYGSYVVEALSVLSGDVQIGFVAGDDLSPVVFTVPGFFGMILPRRPESVTTKTRKAK